MFEKRICIVTLEGLCTNTECWMCIIIYSWYMASWKYFCKFLHTGSLEIKARKLMKLHVRTVLTLYFSDPRVGANASALKLWYRINIGGNVECKTKNQRSLVKAQCSRDMICNWQSRFISAAKMYIWMVYSKPGVWSLVQAHKWWLKLRAALVANWLHCKSADCSTWWTDLLYT